MTMLERAARVDPATKQDIADLRSDIVESRAATTQDISDLRVEMHRSLRGQLLAFAAIVAAFNGTVFAALKLG